jgi:hypothetical protein
MKHKEMVLFPSQGQFDLKYSELILDYDYEDDGETSTECYWTIPFYPKNKEELIGTKIYFYDRWSNRIALRATITRFGEVDSKNTVVFKLIDDDFYFKLDLERMGIEKRTQFRGWCYRWFPLKEEDE